MSAAFRFTGVCAGAPVAALELGVDVLELVAERKISPFPAVRSLVQIAAMQRIEPMQTNEHLG
jgi:hypothetical protein